LRKRSRYPTSTVIDLFDDYEESSKLSRTSGPAIREGKRTLSLHFNIFGIQSEMDTKAPNRLVLGYTRTMMGFLVFNPQPQHIGMIGLGGGSIQKHCHRHLPHTQISVAEISPEVIALRDCFCIPKDDNRFKVSCEDGADFVRRQQSQFDVLMVDGFDEAGQPPQLCSQGFYNNCRTALAPEGILVVNVCDSRNSVLISRMRRSFRNRVLVVGGDDGTNTIVFAARGNILGRSNEQFTINEQNIERAAASLRDVGKIAPDTWPAEARDRCT
jgi:spermidine synthase